MDKDQKNAFALLGGLAAAMLAAKKITEPSGSFAKTGLPVPLKLTGSDINLKDSKGTVDRYINKLNISSEQIAIRQKQLRNLPTDQKGRVSRDDVYDVFSSNINYHVMALSEPLDSILISSKSDVYKAMRKLSSLIEPAYRSWFETNFHKLMSSYSMISATISKQGDSILGRYRYQNVYEAVINGALHDYTLPNALSTVRTWSYPRMRKGDLVNLLNIYRNIIKSILKIDLYEEVETQEKIPSIEDDPGAKAEDIEYYNQMLGIKEKHDTNDPNNAYKTEMHIQKISKQKLKQWYEQQKTIISLASIFGPKEKTPVSLYFGVNTVKKLKLLYQAILAVYNAAPEYYDLKSPFMQDLLKLSKKRTELSLKSQIKKKIDRVLPGFGTDFTEASQGSTKYGSFGSGSILDLKKSFNSNSKKATEVECLLYIDLKKVMEDQNLAAKIENELASHFSVEGSNMPLFWFRGLIVNDTLYVQELQSDHASNIRKNNANKWERQGRESKSKKFKWNLDRTDALSYKTLTIQSIMQQFQHFDEDDAVEDFDMEIGFARERLIYEQGMTPEKADQIVEQMKINGIKKYDIPKTHVPPTDWLRSDIIMAFAFAACLGLKKVGFCSAAASIATVGGGVTGQRRFYNTIVPEKVRSVAKKYNIKQLDDKDLFFTQSGMATYNDKLSGQKEPIVRDSNDLYATMWSLENAYEFFREKGYPIFG